MIGTILLLRITRQWFNRISEAKDYFLRTFYKEAPIPRALKLGSPDSALSFENNSETFKFLDREMDLYLRSGASLIFRCDLFLTDKHFKTFIRKFSFFYDRMSSIDAIDAQ
jgi:hypothetical protein